MAFGIDVPDATRTGFSRAMDAAQYALSRFDPQQSKSSASSPFDEPDPEQQTTGSLLTRDAAVPAPSFEPLPGLAALLDLSPHAGAALLGHEPAETPDDDEWHQAARPLLAHQLRTAAERVQIPAQL